ncbi:MAG: 2-oxo acid dehydrogenase subunit E2, partial [Alkalibacterium sp.]
MYDVILPDAGEGTVESEIVAWFFDEGDEVKEDDILLEMQSDKAVV